MKKPLLALVFSLFFSSQTALAAFDDVSTDHPYYEGISYLELVGAIDPGTNFRPDDPVTRAELFKILFKTLHVDKPSVEKSSFSDVSVEAWFSPYAELAREYNLVSSGPFEGSTQLSRGKVLSTVMEAYGLSAPIIPASERSPLFEDVSIKHPLYSLIYQAATLGFVDASVGEMYLPFSKLTRGELADLLYRAETWENEKGAVSASEEFYKSDIFADIWNRILNEFYLPDGYEIDEDVLFEAAVGAVLDSLDDPYSTYFAAGAATEFMDSLEGEFEGIGAMLTQDAETLDVFITGVLDASPALEAGLQSGDRIVAVDGIDVEGMALEEVMSRIKGPADTEVRLTIERDGTETTYRLIRARLGIDLVKGHIYKGDIWFIEIETFASNIYEDATETINQLKAEEPNPSAIVLDLRGNPGGYINMSNYIAGQFVPHLTPLVTLDYGGGVEETIYNGDKGQYYGIPTYILVDEYTASASEILAQTLKESGTATVIGTQTFGKGSAQELITYWDGSLLKLTIAHWLSSKGTSVQGTGVTPDVVVTEEDGEGDEWLEALNDEL